MKNFAKKMLAVAVAAILAMSVLAGCSAGVKPENYGSTVVATYGDEKIYLDEANMYLRAEQYYYEYLYTYLYGMSNFWNQEVVNGVTMKDSVQESVMSMVRQIYVLKDYAEAQGLALTAEDLAKVETTVDSVLAESDDALVKAYNLTRERMIQIYTTNAMANLAWEALVADIDTNVNELEIRCVGASYVQVSEPAEGATDTRSAQEKAQAIYDAVVAGTVIDDAAKDNGLTATTTAYCVSDEHKENTLGAKAITMAKGEVAVFQLEEGKEWYVMVLNTLNDEEATETVRQNVLSQRKSEMFTAKYPDLQKDSAEFTVDEKVWKSISLDPFF